MHRVAFEPMRLSSGPRPAATLWLLSLLLLARCAAAGPVAVDEAASAPMGIEAAPAGAPGVATAPLDGLATSTTGVAGGRPANNDAAPAGSALALELLKEAEAGASASDGVRRTPRATAQTAGTPPPAVPTSRSQTGEGESDGALREIGKAAVHWLQESLPWLRKDPEEDDRRHNAMPGMADWSESPLEGGKAGRGGRVGAMVPADGAALAEAGPDTAVGYGSSAQRAPDPQHNLIQEFIQLLRTVLEHPMTWLIVSLFVAGGIAIRKFDRRPK